MKLIETNGILRKSMVEFCSSKTHRFVIFITMWSLITLVFASCTSNPNTIGNFNEDNQGITVTTNPIIEKSPEPQLTLTMEEVIPIVDFSFTWEYLQIDTEGTLPTVPPIEFDGKSYRFIYKLAVPDVRIGFITYKRNNLPPEDFSFTENGKSYEEFSYLNSETFPWIDAYILLGSDYKFRNEDLTIDWGLIAVKEKEKKVVNGEIEEILEEEHDAIFSPLGIVTVETTDGKFEFFTTEEIDQIDPQYYKCIQEGYTHIKDLGESFECSANFYNLIRNKED